MKHKPVKLEWILIIGQNRERNLEDRNSMGSDVRVRIEKITTRI